MTDLQAALTENADLRAVIAVLEAEIAALRAERAEPEPHQVAEWAVSYHIERMSDTEEQPWQTEVFPTIDQAVGWVKCHYLLHPVKLVKRDDGSYGGGAIGGGKMLTVRIERKEA